MVEYLAFNQGIEGSNPSRRTIYSHFKQLIMINFYGKKVFVNHKGVQEERRVTLSATYKNQDDGTTIAKVAMAACSLKDRFSRARGRSITHNRLQHNRLVGLIHIDPENHPNRQFNEWCASYCEEVQPFAPAAIEEELV